MNLSKNKIVALFILTIFCLAFASYTFFTSSTSTNSKAIEFTGTVNEFNSEIRKNPLNWANKTVAIKGRVTFLNSTNLTLNSQVFCKYKKLEKLVSLNQEVIVKGKVVLYDSLMGELYLEECIVLESN